jgi:O-antigen ligase
MSSLISMESIPPAIRRIGPGPLIGIGIGYAILSLWSFDTRWAAYGTLGVIGALGLYLLTTVVRRLDPLFAWAFLFSIQFFLSFNIIHEDKTISGGVQGINISLTLVLAAACATYWLYRYAIGRERVWHIDRTFLIICVAFVAVSALSFFNTTSLSYSVYGFSYNIALAFIALVTCHLCSTREGIARLWRVFIAMLIFQSLVLVIQRALGISFDMSGEIVWSRWGDRYGGTMGVAPVNAATLLMVMLFFAEIQLLTTRGYRSLVAWGGAFGLGTVCLLLSLTRSCWVGFAIGSVYIFWQLAHRRFINGARVIMLAAGLVVALAVAWGPVRERIDANHENAAEERWKLNFVNLNMMKAHPVVGIGLNTAYDSKMQYLPSWFTEYDWIYIAHNQYLLIGAETGILGLLMFVWLHFNALGNTRRAARARDAPLASTGIAMTAALIAITWGMFLDFYSGMQVYTFLWMLYGVAAGLRVLQAREAAGRAGERVRDAA